MKKNNFIKTALICAAGVSCISLYAQCPAASSIYTVNTNGKKYEIIKERADPYQAGQCAALRGGYLLEINSAAEQNAVFTALQSPAAGINLANTTAPDGGGASYVWTGGKRTGINQWWWDGNDDNTGTFFWQGGPASLGGMPLSGAYVNWGNEPDNFNGNQFRLALALTSWPMGGAGQWNDLNEGNQLYYVIEYASTLGTDDVKSEKESVQLYPNAVTDFLNVKSKKNITVVTLTDANGRQVKSIAGSNRSTEKVDCTSLSDGVYFVEIQYQDKTSTQHKILKTH